MTQKEFATRLLKHVESTCPDACNIYSDKHVDGTRVLRIKCGRNRTPHSNAVCQEKLTDLLAGYPTFVKVTVRECRDSYVGLDWCIQVEYRNSLPDLNSPKPESRPESNILESEVSESRTEGGMIRVVTPFGIGYAKDEVDKARMMLWLEGVKAGMAYIEKSQAISYAESPDPEADFDKALSEIDAERMSDWWSLAEELRTEYPTVDDETAEDLMHNAFDEWFSKM